MCHKYFQRHTLCRLSITVQYHDVSVVVPFRDDEELIGNLVANLAHHLRGLRCSFEIIAVDDDSRDNSLALLTLIRSEYPELILASASNRDHGHLVGARQARGRIVWFVEPGAMSLSAFSDAYHRVDTGEVDVVIEDDIALARRIRITPLLEDLRGRGARFHRQLASRAERSRLLVRTPGHGRAGRHRRTRRLRWMTLLASVLRQPLRHAG